MKKTLFVDLSYHRSDGRHNEIRVRLEDVRAADSLIITYDFDRDGWRIGMDKTKDDDFGSVTVEEDCEVAFIPAWNQ